MQKKTLEPRGFVWYSPASLVKLLQFFQKAVAFLLIRVRIFLVFSHCKAYYPLIFTSISPVDIPRSLDQSKYDPLRRHLGKNPPIFHRNCKPLTLKSTIPAENYQFLSQSLWQIYKEFHRFTAISV